MVFKKIRRDRRGSVSVLAAFFFVAMAAAAALGLQSAHLYIVKLKSQRVGDLASLAAANTSSPIVNNAVSATATATALNIATINGFGGSTVVTSISTSPTNDGNQTLSTKISQDVPLLFGMLLGNRTVAPVATASLTEIKTSTAGPCVTSVIWQTVAIAGANVQGPNCYVSANFLLWVDSFSKLNVKQVYLGTSSALEAIWIAFASLLSPAANAFVYNAAIADPLSGNASITAIANHLNAIPSRYNGVSPIPVLFGGTSYTYPYSYPAGPTLWTTSSGMSDPTCTSPLVLGNLTFSGSTTITLTSGCYIVNGSITQLNGSTTFAIATGAQVNLIVTGAITNLAGTMVFGDATYAIGGVVTNSGSGMTFGKGQKTFVGGIVNNVGTMIVGDGPYYFYLGGITTGLLSTTVFGTGTMDFYLGSVTLSGNTTFGYGGSAVTGSSMISLYGGFFTLVQGNLTASGVTIALTTGAAGFYGTGSINVTAPTGPSPTYGYQNILVYATGLQIPAFALNGGTVDVAGGLFILNPIGGNTTIVSGLVYVPGSFIGIGGIQTVAPPANGCLQLVGSGVVFVGTVNVSLAPCTTGSAALSAVATVQ